MARTTKKTATRKRRPAKKKAVARKRAVTPNAAPEATTAEGAASFTADYKIIMGVSAADLANAVAMAIRQGWFPTGGVCNVPPDPMSFAMAARDGKPPHPYWQAMIRNPGSIARTMGR